MSLACVLGARASGPAASTKRCARAAAANSDVRLPPKGDIATKPRNVSRACQCLLYLTKPTTVSALVRKFAHKGTEMICWAINAKLR
jgi:hypothetical protein